MNLGVCPYCNEAIEVKGEHALVAYHIHSIGNYEVVYAPKQGNIRAITQVYERGVSDLKPSFQLPGIDRALTEETIERLLLLK